RDVRDALRVGHLQGAHVVDGLDEDDRLGRLAHRPDHLHVAGVADEDDGVASAAYRRASECTFVTSGQVASIVRSPIRAALACTDGATPCAESTSTLPVGTSSSEATKIAPSASRSRTTWLLWTICRRT